MHVCQEREVSWDAMKNGILMIDFIAEARIWMSIICSWVSPTTNMTNVPTMHAQMVVCILYNISLNVARFMLMEIQNYKNKRVSC